MKDFDFHASVKKFLLGEVSKKELSMKGCIQSLEEVFKSIVPRTQADDSRMEIAFEALRGIKKHYKRLNEENYRMKEELNVLQEKLSLLESNSNCSEKEEL